MSSDEIILYDLPSKGQPHCWSLNPWKARAALNYKGLPYRTEWIEYPDLAPTFKEFGMAPNDGASSYADYSAPAIKLPNETYVMDSRKIGEVLEKLQPFPKLHMERGDLIDRTQAAVGGTLANLGPIGMPRIPERLLNPRSAEYFHETRSKRFGMPLPELAKSDRAGENAWKNAEPHLTELKNILNEVKSGPYVLGEEVSFPDFIIAGLWHFVKLLDDNGDLYDRGMKIDASFPKHVEACQRFFEKDD